MTDLVTVYKRKVNGHESRRFEAEVVPSPRPGWIATFSDSTRHAHVKQGVPVTSSPYRYIVYLLATERMLTTSFYFAGDRSLIEAQCDVALPATRDGSSVVFIDLELDLIVKGDGSHYLRDFREFAENRVRMEYSDETVAGARRALLESLRLFRKGQFPFDGSARAILDQRLDGTG